MTELTFDLPGGDADPGWEPYLDAVSRREGQADVTGGFAGRVYGVNPHVTEIEGVACVPPLPPTCRRCRTS